MTTSAVVSQSITLTRYISAPRELVFEAWTNPEHLLHWWGPR
ncbi:MAG: ATPase, partial [Chloroflexi bacterium]